MIRALSSFASGPDTLKIFYDINKYDLSDADKQSINVLIGSIGNKDTVKVFGYADYLGDEDDNMELSFSRAKTIKAYLLTLNKDFMIITSGEGELPATKRRSAQGDPNSRRVDIVKIKFEGRFMPLNASKNKANPPQRKTPILPGPPDKRPFEAKINDLANLKPGTSLNLPEITFQPGRHFLNRESVPMVDTLLRYLKKHNNLAFEIRGHICCVLDDGDSYDPDARSFVLSANRAKYIYDYFVTNGINPSRMTYKGLGSSDPKVWPEFSENDRALNRRVEIVIINNK
ncbi:MAG TPA: OmpA family protein [Mucilaginibacter sp.]|jgi:outer membrane protein OmpA-like peptidoglycan-associated protein|nr:OmpA family protein [Mucilaginibacter sp.]